MNKLLITILFLAVFGGDWNIYGQTGFGNPTNLGSPVNSIDREVRPSISADGLELYFESTRPGFGVRDIWVSKRATINDDFGTPVNLGSTINGTAFDGGPNISADGLTLYFGSERPGGHGARDLYMTTRATTSHNFSAPVNLGPVVNSASLEATPSISADGLTLYFASTRHGGAPDIYVTTRASVSESFGTPVNLGPPVNGAGVEVQPSISSDGLSLYLLSDRPGGLGGFDLWVASRASVSDPFQTPVNLGTSVNSQSDDVAPNISADRTTLYFSSDRSGAVGGAGDFDLWQVTDLSTAVSENTENVPTDYVLFQNYPNPFNPTTTITFELPKTTLVNLSVYNAAGQLVETVVNERQDAGSHSVIWNASKLSSGIYFYRIVAGEHSQVRKSLLLK